MKRMTAIGVLGAALLSGLVPPCAVAAPPATDDQAMPADQPTIPLLHARWLTRDGAPADIGAFAQTPDGWLWLAGPTGLYRFDGVSFSRYQPPAGVDLPNNINKIGTLADGRLWVAPYFGGLFLIDGPQVTAYGKAEGVPVGVVGQVAAAPDGRLWFAAGKGLHVLERGAKRWRAVEVVPGLDPVPAAHDLHIDRAGALWVQTNRGNFVQRPGMTGFTLVAPQQTPGRLDEGPDGTMWYTDLANGGLRKLGPTPPSPALDKLLARTQVVDKFFVDRSNNLWLPSSMGLMRIAQDGDAPQLQGFTMRQGLSGETAYAAFEDREGSIWISTDGGIDQFRRGRMHGITLPHYGAEARPLTAGANGELWIDYAWLARADARPVLFGPAPSIDTIMNQMHRDRHGTVWYGTFSALWKLDGRTRVPVPLPPEVSRLKQQPMFAMALDADDALWISLGPRGTWRLKDGAWVQHGGIAALELYPAVTIVAGPNRKLWFGSLGNNLALLQDGVVRNYGRAEGLEVGTIMQIVPDERGAWLGGDDGLAYFDGARARRIAGADGEQFTGNRGMVITPAGDLWLHSPRGLVRIAAGELARALAEPGHRVAFRRFDENDGLVGAPGSLLPLPSMVRTTTGELVISTTRGVYRFDPARDPGNRLAPPVHITGVSADDVVYPLLPGVALPAAPGTVRIDYTALSLALPRRVRFQYQLDGVDRGWQDAGTRRAAFYNNLDPGRYTFRVKAANDDGVWNEAGAQLAFDVPPTLTQTWWFRAAVALALILAAFGLHRLRLRMALRRLSRSFEARVAERERIARDLHDTLLQSVQGLIMHFRRIALRTPDDAPTRPLMQEALALAVEVLEEGRDKVGGLRDTTGHADLACQLREHGQRLADQHGVAFALDTTGQAQRLRPEVQDEVLAIGREAVRNAFLHAQARRIDIALRWGEREFELAVTDDGIGIDPVIQQGRAGHWGIPGMRERAAELGASIELRSSPSQGSTWLLRMPARLAYDSHQLEGALA